MTYDDAALFLGILTAEFAVGVTISALYIVRVLRRDIRASGDHLAEMMDRLADKLDRHGSTPR